MIATFDRARPATALETRPWAAASLWLCGLTAFFFLSYGFANWATGLRGDVRSIVFGWEHRIPFLPWTIVPYCSIDVLYAASLLLCRTKAELNAHAKRLAAAQIISIAAFLLFPLCFSFEQPRPAGLFGSMFYALKSFDGPFNQAPSLHMSLTTILWAMYSQLLDRVMLWMMRMWMILIGVSTLTTFQHHFIDLPTGVWVGLICLVLFPDKERVRSRATPDRRRISLGVAYLAGAILLAGVAFRIGGAAWWLLWPGGTLSILAGIYWSGHPELFRKANGTMPPAMIGLLAPYLAAAWLNSRLWTRKEPAASEIADDVWLGRVPRRVERDAQAIASVVDLTAELPVDAAGVAYRGVPMLDLLAPTVEQLEAAVKAIEELKFERPTLVCCALGYSRSAAAVAAWMTASGRAPSIDESIRMLRARRPGIVLNPAHRARLEEWRRARAGGAQ